jgi:tetratricopeptide (TPR) repeat protein
MENLASTYPFPVAFVLHTEVLNAATARDRAEGLIRLSNMALQYAALVAASNYAAAPWKDEQVSSRFERLKRPLVSDFAYFLRASVPVLHQHNALFVPELDGVIQTVTREQVRALHMGERGLEERELSLLDALVNLRNALAHDRFRGQWEAFVNQHEPLVWRLLETMDWCARYPLLRLVADGQWVRLMGATPAFAAQPIADAALDELARTQRAQESTGLLLGNPELTRFLTLYPFVLWAECPYCEQEPLLGLTEEAFLFNGDEGRRYVAYIGVRHPRPLRDPKARLDQVYAAKAVPPAPVAVRHMTYPLLYERARRQSELWLQENIVARRYVPQVYHARTAQEAAMEGFLRGGKTGFLLLGEAGMGKTTLLCHTIEVWRERGEVVLFYAGHQLAPEAALEERLLRDLHVTGEFLELVEFLRREGRRLLLVVDGVNEHPNAPALLPHLCTFITRYANPSPVGESSPAVQVILSFRAVFFHKTLQAVLAGGGDEASLFPTTAFQTHMVEEQGRKVETYRFTLEQVDAEELEALYEGYRQYAGRPDHEGRLVRWCPQTSFASLSLSVRRVLTHPWYLRMAMEAYDGKPIPPTLWTGDILKAFCDAKIYGRTPEEAERFASRANLVEELVALMRAHQTETFRRDELHDLSPRWSRVLLEQEVARSPYLQLVDEGVLMEVPETEVAGRRTRTRYLVRFAFDALFEYLLADDLLREVGGWEHITGEFLASLLEAGKAFDPFTGTAELLLTDTAQQGNFRLLTTTLNATEKWTAVPVFVNVLTTLDGMGHPNFAPSLTALAEWGEGEKAVTVLLSASYTFGEKQRFRPMLACTEHAQRLGQRLVEAEGRTELANDLAMALMNKGVALQSLGQPREAIESYDAAIGIYRRLVEAEGRTELANDLAMALMNKGLVLEQQEQWQDALACYDKGIGLWTQLVESGMAHLTPDLLRGLGIRFDLWQRFEEWEAAAADVVSTLHYAIPFLQSDGPPETFVQEWEGFLERLRTLSDTERAQLYTALGEWADVVRELMQE